MSSGNPVTLAPGPSVEAASPAAPPMTPTLSTASTSSNLSAPESTMWSAQSSRRTSENSLTSVPMAVSASADNLAKPAQPQLQSGSGPKTGQNSQAHKTDPLLRTYPKPEAEINVSEALRRAPLKWTLGYWAKNARELSPAPAPASASAAAALLEQKKQELRQAQRELDQAVLRKR